MVNKRIFVASQSQQEDQDQSEKFDLRSSHEFPYIQGSSTRQHTATRTDSGLHGINIENRDGDAVISMSCPVQYIYTQPSTTYLTPMARRPRNAHPATSRIDSRSPRK